MYGMDKIELVRKIGYEVCENCWENKDCGIETEDCDRIRSALNLIDEYLRGDKE